MGWVVVLGSFSLAVSVLRVISDVSPCVSVLLTTRETHCFFSGGVATVLSLVSFRTEVAAPSEPQGLLCHDPADL